MEWFAKFDHPRLSLIEKIGKQLLIHNWWWWWLWWQWRQWQTFI